VQTRSDYLGIRPSRGNLSACLISVLVCQLRGGDFGGDFGWNHAKLQAEKADAKSGLPLQWVGKLATENFAPKLPAQIQQG